MKVAVIGSGIAGLATAIRLQARGAAVTVYEANDYPGGKLTAFEQDGFRFDAGPSLLTMPHLIDELFEAAGKNPTDHFRYESIPVACHYFWPDGKSLLGHAKAEDFAKAAADQFDIDPQRILNYFKHCTHLYDKTGKIFTEQSLHKASTWLTMDVAKSLAQIYSYDLNKTMDAANRKRIGEPHLVQLFNRFATYNGSDPYQAPGILNVIPHLEHGIGTFVAEGGMHSITQSLVELAESLGVELQLQSRVEEILVQQGNAKGVNVNGKEQQFDLVVSNMDVVPTYQRLMPTQKQPEKILQQERSSSALIFYWGVQHSFEQLGLHNIFFSEDYKAEFEHIFQQKKRYHDPTIYVNISSKYEAGDAPEGMENWFVMINVPCNEGQDWKAWEEEYKKLTIQKLSAQLNVNLENLIVTESVLDPQLIESKTSSFKGALYGTASNDKMAAFLRHPNFSSKIKGLYFCGGSVHPGGGIPLCLLSAKITDQLIAKDHRLA